MSVIIGIDIGGSTTKIVGFTSDKKIIEPMFVQANDQKTSAYGAFGKFTDTNGIKLSEIEKIMITGVGSTFIGDELYSIPCEHVREFDANGRGALYLSGLSEALVVSMGTGTAMVYANGNNVSYDGGTGVGGGTLIGLSKQMLGVSDTETLFTLAKDGDLNNVDLRIGDITKKDISPTLSAGTTAANFGNLSELATPADIACGLINLVFETIGMVAVFAAKSRNINDIVLIGSLTRNSEVKHVFDKIANMFGLKFYIPDRSRYGTVIGAALCYFEK
ncbi:MAG: type II pantothenate kinase [Clostridia bacterium]|nr:type II pantothenate kinase [Clostridia bacterium]